MTNLKLNLDKLKTVTLGQGQIGYLRRPVNLIDNGINTAVQTKFERSKRTTGSTNVFGK